MRQLQLQHTMLISHLALLTDAIEHKLALPCVLLHDRLAGVVVALERAPTVFDVVVPDVVVDALQQALAELDATALNEHGASATTRTAAKALATSFRESFRDWLQAPASERAVLCARAHDWMRVLRDEQVNQFIVDSISCVFCLFCVFVFVFLFCFVC